MSDTEKEKGEPASDMPARQSEGKGGLSSTLSIFTTARMLHETYKRGEKERRRQEAIKELGPLLGPTIKDPTIK